MVLLFGCKGDNSFKHAIVPIFRPDKYKKEGGSVGPSSALPRRHRLTEENKQYLESIGYTVL